jgi:hypothetical protein
MHNPPNFRRPNPPSLPSKFATTSLPSPPALPYEIFINILGQLRDDKPSLAKCMRVSSTFNTITAHILYTSVIVDAGRKNPYDTTRGSPVAARLSSDAAANVGMIKNVIVLSHPPIEVVKGLMASIQTRKYPSRRHGPPPLENLLPMPSRSLPLVYTRRCLYLCSNDPTKEARRIWYQSQHRPPRHIGLQDSQYCRLHSCSYPIHSNRYSISPSLTTFECRN